MLFGSVTQTQLADTIWDKLKVRVDRRKIGMDEPLKRIGRYQVPIELFADVTVETRVLVVPEGGELPPEEELQAIEEAEAAEAAAAEAAHEEEHAAAEAAIDEEIAADEVVEEPAAEGEAAPAPAAEEPEPAGRQRACTRAGRRGAGSNRRRAGARPRRSHKRRTSYPQPFPGPVDESTKNPLVARKTHDDSVRRPGERHPTGWENQPNVRSLTLQSAPFSDLSRTAGRRLSTR